MKKNSIAFVALTVLLAACSDKKNDTNTQSNDKAIVETKDLHTLSNADSIRMKHLSLDLSIDLAAQKLSGWATWDIENPSDVKTLRLDNNKLKIDSVLVDDKAVIFDLGVAQEHLGAALMIPIGKASQKVAIKYSAGDGATALQWLNAAQTTGKKHPFLYTQSESIYARTWVPCPDGPDIRFTYSARIAVPKGMMAVMSADGNPLQANDSGIYHFEMKQAIPAYLLALAVGDIRFKTVDNRTGVYAEPEMIDKVHYEFADMGKMVNTAESLYGPYRWGSYDVIVLPPGFPIGGMENPKLTFCTPTVIAGDRSLVNLIAHELAHNWSGNLVTNATWDDIWMNEGFTVYFERRISEAMNDKTYVNMLWELGYQDLEAAVEEFGMNSPKTWLKQNLKGKDADEGLSDIPYEKGALFLWLIEQNVGREKWDLFLKKYFEEHAFKTITTEKFLAYLGKNLLKGDSALYKKININAWVYGPGIPANAPRAAMERFEKVNAERKKFLKENNGKNLITQNWTTHEWLHFLRKMPKTLSLEQMKSLDEAFHFTQSKNSEIADLWFIMAVRANYVNAYGAMEQFLSITGRQKFILPLYQEMMQTGKKEMAKNIYKKYRANYHPLAQSKLDKITQ
ncbi:MAG: M1 family metallopeptidase [Phycisphaerales bacterium]|nr:M1 family metallopeptidase [Phycisphaerales bacterium]